VLAHIVHDWSDAAAQTILETCARALPRDGRILLVENVLPADNAPGRTQWLDLEMLVLTPGGRERTSEEFRSLAEGADLELVSVTATGGSRAVLELRPSQGAR
jgi:hypothetical protein